MAQHPQVPEAFAEAVSKRLARLVHKTTINDSTNSSGDKTVLSAAVDGMSLMLALEPNSETVASACFIAPLEQPEAAVLDMLCDYAPGATVREVLEHGLIYAMESLRDNKVPSPVPGVLTPRNAGAMFETPLRIVAELRKSAREAFGRSPDTNFFDRPYSAEWTALDKAGKQALVGPHIEAFRKARGIAPDTFELVEIDQYDRLFLVFSDEVDVWDKPVLLMELERWLRKRTGERIELFAELAKDANRIRRL